MSVPRYAVRDCLFIQDVAVTSREGRVSRNEYLIDYEAGVQPVTSREGRVSRNVRDRTESLSPTRVTSREGRVSRNDTVLVYD